MYIYDWSFFFCKFFFCKPIIFIVREWIFSCSNVNRRNAKWPNSYGEAVVLNSWDQEITSWTVELKSKKSIEEVEYMLRQRERGFSIMALVTTVLWIIMWLGLWLVWISMLIHAIKHAQKNKTLWILVIIFWNVVWALLYYFIGKKETKQWKQNKYEHHKMPKNYHNPKNN